MKTNRHNREATIAQLEQEIVPTIVVLSSQGSGG